MRSRWLHADRGGGNTSGGDAPIGRAEGFRVRHRNPFVHQRLSRRSCAQLRLTNSWHAPCSRGMRDTGTPPRSFELNRGSSVGRATRGRTVGLRADDPQASAPPLCITARSPSDENQSDCKVLPAIGGRLRTRLGSYPRSAPKPRASNRERGEKRRNRRSEVHR